MSSFLDANVWLALIWQRHAQSDSALEWFRSSKRPIVYCRFVQLTVLRLLTTSAILGPDTKSMRGAWLVWDRISRDPRFALLPEPEGFETVFRKAAHSSLASPKAWADAYLSAFAEAAQVELVTFDKALARRTAGSVLLR